MNTLVKPGDTPGFEQFGVANDQRQERIMGDAHTGINSYGYDGMSAGVESSFSEAGIQLVSDGGRLVNMAASALPEFFGFGQGVSESSNAKGTYADRALAREVGGRPIINYSPSALLDSLALYNQSHARMSTTDPLASILLSGEYQWFGISLPANAFASGGGLGTANLAPLLRFRATNRYQVNVPPGSILLGIAGNSVTLSIGGEGGFIFEVPAMVQIYDDGAGEYLFDKPISMALCSGELDQTGLLAGFTRGMFWLPSCLTVCKSGMLTVSLTSRDTSTTGDSTSATAGANDCQLALYFAVPKSCIGERK